MLTMSSGVALIEALSWASEFWAERRVYVKH